MDYIADLLELVVVGVFSHPSIAICSIAVLWVASLLGLATHVFREEIPELTYEDLQPASQVPQNLGLVPAEEELAGIPELNVWDLLLAQEEPVVAERVSSVRFDPGRWVDAFRCVIADAWGGVITLSAAALPAVMSGGVVPTTGRHLPVPSGDPCRGRRLLPRPPWRVAWHRHLGVDPPSVVVGTTRCRSRRVTYVWVAHGMSSDPPPRGDVLALASMITPFILGVDRTVAVFPMSSRRTS